MDSKTLNVIRALVAAGDVRISDHGYDELSEDRIYVRDILASLAEAVLLEDYPTFGKGPAVLVLQKDQDDRLIHVVWGLPKEQLRPAVLVTAYRPDPSRWSADFKERRR